MRRKSFLISFTLIELLIVVAIIGTLAGILFVSIGQGPLQKARDSKRKADLKSIEMALLLYYDSYGKYPLPRPSSSCGGSRPDWATSYCSEQNWLTTDNNFLMFLNSIPRDPSNKLGIDDTPWWFALTYIYGASTDGQRYDLLTNLENTSDPERCELRLWRSYAVWPLDTGCYSAATPGNVPDRAKQIWAVK